MTGFQTISNYIRTVGKSEGRKPFTFAEDDPPYVKTRRKESIDQIRNHRQTNISKEHGLLFVVIVASAIIPIVNVIKPSLI
jgi:hypothetical protein